ncbi:hypothetical protein A2999_01330 [Candidatus Wolfebacteria bacterium RIFCSPLOWO2_01_FULL_38_11]|uniref:Uncharacterized protein n=1 Tax=Candidatus Wolfebacteria bacterium RIFCSPLOWO2_01_FULL_38_11 TaxID=1802556 RepID=A0A1F8DTQ5_9BACT|nr:MAG: hypothetical protein A2999_01330 [Candidatus Wolfebacteria bacterium RIFCSPLOWO2_01_FULL_38_11]
MKFNLLIIIGLSLMIIMSGLITNTAFAITKGEIPGSGDLGINQILPSENIGGVVGLIIYAFQWIYTIFFIIAGIMILFAAFTYLTSGGDPEKVGSAKNQIIYAVVAIVVALLAVSINLIVKSFVSTGQ